MFKPSEQQLAIFDGAKKGENLIINAGPGSGKSTTLVQQVHELPDDKNILLVVFNNATAKELNEKMPNNCVVSTAHKLGYSMAYKKYEFNKWLHGDYGDLSKKINQVFFFKLLDNGFSHKEANQFLIYLSEVISKLRLTLTDYNNEEAVINTLTHYNLPYERPDLIKWCMEEMINAYHNKGWVDFDDMIYLPVALNMSPIGKTFKDLNGKSRLLSSFDIILLDEAQDLSFAYLKLLDIIISSNTNMQIIAVGDEHQAINGFNGSSPDAMQIIQNHYNLKPYDLTISYRCPKEHLDYINDLFGTKLTSGNNRTGVIHNILFDDIINYIEIGDLIISRNQRGKDAKLLPVMKMLVNNQIPCRLLGFDLVSIAKKQFNKSFKKKALVWDIFIKLNKK